MDAGIWGTIFPTFLMCLLLCVFVCVGLTSSLRIPPFVLPWGRHASYIPLNPHHHHCHHHHLCFFFFPLHPLLTGFSVTMATHVCLLSACYLFHILPCLTGSVCLSVCLSAHLSVTLSACWLFVCPWLAFLCLLFVCLFLVFYVSAWLSVWLFSCVRPCLCLLSVSLLFFCFFSLTLSPADWLYVWPPGFSTSNPSSPLSALLLCSGVPLNIHLSTLLFFSFPPPL